MADLGTGHALPPNKCGEVQTYITTTRSPSRLSLHSLPPHRHLETLLNNGVQLKHNMPRYTPPYKYSFGHTFDALPEFAKDYLQYVVPHELESPEDVLAYAAYARAFLVLTLWRIVQKDQRSPEEQLRNMWNELNGYLINFDALIWLQTETQARCEGKDYKFQGYNEYQGYTYEDQSDSEDQGDPAKNPSGNLRELLRSVLSESQ